MPPGVPPLALFRAVAHNPRVLGRMRRGGLLDPGSITVRQREIVILRTTARCRSEYEWGVHVAFFAEAAALTSDQIAATVHGGHDDPAWSEEESLLVALAVALHERADLPDAIDAALAARFTPAQRVELVFLAGLYHAVSFLTNALRLEPEAGCPRFPAPPPARATETARDPDRGRGLTVPISPVPTPCASPADGHPYPAPPRRAAGDAAPRELTATNDASAAASREAAALGGASGPRSLRRGGASADGSRCGGRA